MTKPIFSPHNRRPTEHGMTRLELIVTIGVTSVLLVFLLPTLTKVTCSCAQNKDLSNSKQIYLGLKMYAGDHNGDYPNEAVDGGPLTNANEAYRHLIPDYIPTEEPFYMSKSPWTPKAYDFKKDIRAPLDKGRNHWAYVPNLRDDFNPHLPLIATGFGKGTPGTYSPSQKVGKGKGVIGVVVIRNGGSGKVGIASEKDFRYYDDDGTAKEIDLFKPAPGWLRQDQLPLNPEG